LVQESLEDDKAIDIVSINLQGKTLFADNMVIASGRSGRHIGSMAAHLAENLKKAEYGSCRTEGMAQGDWVLLDAGDVVVHLFRPEVRAFYNLEKMWSVDMSVRGADEHAAG
jgi:ribosome-associated protein